MILKRLTNAPRRRVLATPVGKKMAALSLSVASMRARSKFRGVHAAARLVDQDWILSERGDQIYLVRVQPQLVTADVYDRNLQTVVDICEAQGIEYFLVPDPVTPRRRIGIADNAWSTFIKAVVKAGAAQPVYVSRITRTESGVTKRSLLATTPGIGSILQKQRNLEIFCLYAPATTADFYGRPFGCVVEMWSQQGDGSLAAPSYNAITTAIGLDHQDEKTIELASGIKVKTLAPFTVRNVFDVDFPVDAVYMWVDGADPSWQARRANVMADLGMAGSRRTTKRSSHANDASRFRDNGELRYSLRSLEQFAPWVRNVYLVTDQQVPRWLKTEVPSLTVVDHKEIFAEGTNLPSYNSHAIASRLHHITGLARHYLIMNDDVLFARTVHPSLFFQSNGITKFFLSKSTLPFADSDLVTPHEQARKNVADLIMRDFDAQATRNFFHTPVPQDRDLLFELEERYSEEFKRTANNQFRSPDDLEINGWLHNYYGYMLGRCAPGGINYSYFNLAEDSAHREMDALLKKRLSDTMCVNDSPSATWVQRERAGMWLDRYLPFPSRFEQI